MRTLFVNQPKLALANLSSVAIVSQLSRDGGPISAAMQHPRALLLSLLLSNSSGSVGDCAGARLKFNERHRTIPHYVHVAQPVGSAWSNHS